jgi:hypothetical protein
VAQRKGNKRELRTPAAPFTVAAPAGARIRDRLRVDADEAAVLATVGQHLGQHARADLAQRVRIGQVPVKDNRRAERKWKLTRHASSRWAGAVTRVGEDQYQLSLRCLHDQRTSLRRAIRTIGRRLKVACGQCCGRVRGCADQVERCAKQQRLAVLTAWLARVEQRIEAGRPAIVVGGKRLARARHHLDDAGLREAQWRARWEAARLFLIADGESGAPYGNYTITVDPADGSIAIVLPEPLRHLANAPRGRFRLSCTVGFSHRREEWLDRVTANRAVRYDIAYDPVRDRWYLDASWSADAPVPPTPEEIRAFGQPMLGIDLNADHLAAWVLDPHGNPIGAPITVPLELTGPASRRDGRLRAAITTLLGVARRHGCAGFVVENLGFTDARATGRETMGRGRRGKRFRRTVAGIPTAKFRERLRAMAYHHSFVVIAVDPAYTSKWGGQHWQAPLQQQTPHTTTTVTRHHGAAVAIGRRGLGHRIRRRPGVTANHQRMVARRATGQAVSVPKPRGTTSPPRTAGTPNQGGKTRLRRSDQLVLFPDLEDRSRGHRTTCPDSCDSANTSQHR